MNEIKITKVEARPGYAPAKGMTNCGPGFILLVIFHLEDGRTIDSHVTARRKKDLGGALERAQRQATEGNLQASYHEGKFFGTVSRYRIGGAGLVPNPA